MPYEPVRDQPVLAAAPLDHLPNTVCGAGETQSAEG
jgi:hypothetical protein